MKNWTGRAQLLCAVGSAALMTSNSQAQIAIGGEPPRAQFTDPIGIDLSSGQIVRSVGDITIGDKDDPALVITRLGMSGGADRSTPKTNLQLTYECFSNGELCTTYYYYFQMGNRTEWMVGNGSMVTADGSAVTVSSNLYTVTQRDGTKWTYSTNYGSANRGSDGVVHLAELSQIEYPDGRKLIYHYAAKTSPTSIAGLQSIESNLGYQERAILSNSSIDYCDPQATSCTYSRKWPQDLVTVNSDGSGYSLDAEGRKVSYTGWKQGSGPNDSVLTVTDPTGVTFNAANTLFQTTTPTSCFKAAVVQAQIAGQTWKYAWTFSGCTPGQWLASGSSTSPSGAKISFQNGGAGGTWTDANGKATQYQFNTITDSLHQRSVLRDLSYVIYPEGNREDFTYDNNHNLKNTIYTSKSGSTETIQRFYNLTCDSTNYKICNKPSYILDRNGGRYDYTYDPASGMVLTETDPADSRGIRPQIRYTYAQYQANVKNSSGVLVATGLPIWKLQTKSTCISGASCSGTADEKVTRFTYNNNLLPVSEEIDLGNGAQLSLVTRAYDEVGDLISVDGPLAGSQDTTYYRFDATRLMTAVISPDPDGAGPLKIRAIRYSCDAAGRLVLTEHGTLSSVPDASVAPKNWGSVFTVLASSAIDYDAYGRKSADAGIDGASRKTLTQYSYDADGRLQCTAVRMNPASYSSLPASACSLSATGSFGSDRITQNLYDAAGRVRQSIKGVGAVGANNVGIAVETNTYTDNGKVASTADAKGNVTTYQYDGFDRLYKTIYPVPGSGATGSTTDFEQLSYDAGDNITQRRQRDGQLINYTYDALNRKVLVDLPSSSGAVNPDIRYAYDLQGNILSVTDTAGGSVSYSYDSLGRMLSETEGGRTYRSAYDPAGRKIQFTWPDSTYLNYDYLVTGEMTSIRENGASASVVGFGYDDLGRRTNITRPNGVGTTYAYDALSRLTSLSHDLPGTSYDQTFTLGYNPAGQIMSTTRSNDSYAFSNAVNANVSYTTNALNQYVSVQSSKTGTYVYDSRGNVAGSGDASYSYDARNLLISSSAGNSGFTYDPTSRMRTITAEGVVLDYDGPDLVAEYSNSGALLRRYIHGPSSDDALVWYEGSVKNWLLADNQGSIIGTTGSDGMVTHINSYDEFGLPGNANSGRFQYTGQAWIAGVGLYNYKARLYSPTLGRFMQTDPIGYKAGPNWYAYVGNDPVNRVDPTGEYQCLDRQTCNIFDQNVKALEESINLLEHSRLESFRSVAALERAGLKMIGKRGENTGISVDADYHVEHAAWDSDTKTIGINPNAGALPVGEAAHEIVHIVQDAAGMTTTRNTLANERQAYVAQGIIEHSVGQTLYWDDQHDSLNYRVISRQAEKSCRADLSPTDQEWMCQ